MLVPCEHLAQRVTDHGLAGPAIDALVWIVGQIEEHEARNERGAGPAAAPEELPVAEANGIDAYENPLLAAKLAQRSRERRTAGLVIIGRRKQREEAAALHLPRSLQTQKIENGGGKVVELGMKARSTPLGKHTGERQDHRHLEHRLVHARAVSPRAVLQELLAVIRDEDHEGLLRKALLVQPRQNPAEEAVHVGHLAGVLGAEVSHVRFAKPRLTPVEQKEQPDAFARAVPGRGDVALVAEVVEGVEGRRGLVGRVGVDLVQIDEETAVVCSCDEGLDESLPDHLSVLLGSASPRGERAQGAVVHELVEVLREARAKRDLRVVDDTEGRVARALQQRRQVGHGRRKGGAARSYAVGNGVQRRQQRCHRGACPGGVRRGVDERDPAARQPGQRRCGDGVGAVGIGVVRPQRVEENQQDVVGTPETLRPRLGQLLGVALDARLAPANLRQCRRGRATDRRPGNREAQAQRDDAARQSGEIDVEDNLGRPGKRAQRPALQHALLAAVVDEAERDATERRGGKLRAPGIEPDAAAQTRRLGQREVVGDDTSRRLHEPAAFDPCGRSIPPHLRARSIDPDSPHLDALASIAVLVRLPLPARPVAWQQVQTIRSDALELGPDTKRAAAVYRGPRRDGAHRSPIPQDPQLLGGQRSALHGSAQLETNRERLWAHHGHLDDRVPPARPREAAPLAVRLRLGPAGR